MNLPTASLHRRILRAFVLIVVLALVLAIGVGYVVTQRQMDEFVQQLIAVEADSVALSLGRAYASSGGWATVDRVLSDAGYRYDEGAGGHEGHGEREKDGSETFHVERVRIVVVDAGGMVIHDNLSRLRPGIPARELGGERVTVIDGETGRRVGDVYVDVERAFLATESHGLLRRMLTTTALGGALIAAVALALAAWISRRITAPVTRLTEAARTVARQGAITLLPITSADELGQMSAAFNRMTNALQTQRDLRRRLIDDLSHELNTPLSVIQLEAKGLLDGLQEPAQAADRIVREVTMLHNLVRDLNWLAETDSGELRLNRESCSVSDLIGAEVRRWQPQARDAQDQPVVPAAIRIAGARSRPDAHEPGARQCRAQRAATHRGRRPDRGGGGAGTRREGGDDRVGRRRGESTRPICPICSTVSTAPMSPAPAAPAARGSGWQSHTPSSPRTRVRSG